MLLWLKSQSRKTVFVENRIAELRNDSTSTFRHVKSADNPADLLTRGLTVPELEDSTLWWHGPQWLSAEPSLWPSALSTTPEDIVLAETEVKPETLFLTAAAVDSEPPSPAGYLHIDPTRFSSLYFLLRVTAICLKFVRCLYQKIQSQRRTSKITPPADELFNHISPLLPVTSRDLSTVSLLWTRHVQRAAYPDVVSALENNRSHTLVSQLRLKFDSFGLIRCHGRFAHAGLSENTTNPKLLPRRADFTHLFIRHVHGRLIHAGVAHTLAQIRQEFWIPQGRAEVRYILRRCPVCRRHEGNPFRMPATPAWPQERVTRSLPFEFTGVDYLGPVYVRETSMSSPQKLWVALFTCLSTRAIHLEWVHDLSGCQLLNCLRRFVSRRGSPRQLIFQAGENRARSRVTSHPDTPRRAFLSSKPWSALAFHHRACSLARRVLRTPCWSGQACLSKGFRPETAVLRRLCHLPFGS